MARVVLAMSGGVDSSASAVLLRRQGHEVIGLFMRTGVQHPGGEGAVSPRAEHKKGCCSVQDAWDARRVADRLGIPFYALDFRAEFDRIIDYFADEYVRGRTPNPCVVCNTWLKFGQLWEFARQLEADYIATGHYARIVAGPEGAELHRGVDLSKDQSYVLWGIRREILEHILFPVGGSTKSEIRSLAREAGLEHVASKPDSVEICFVPGGRPSEVVRARRPEAIRRGPIVDRQGRILGEHDGIDRFTIGQRKGLGVASGRRQFVLELLPETQTVVVGDYQELLAAGLEAEGVNWLCVPPTGQVEGWVKIRYRHPGVAAVIRPQGEGRVLVRFALPQAAVTPGQAVAFYAADRLLGGGWITRALRE
ncbi:MAG: tRNA 2-thiouridine(34) synthase MnmA [Gemmataceae bacterium]|nr:tRNA 2-thiouridine(34) synthase MnmA [Gemmataceae bacterium]